MADDSLEVDVAEALNRNGDVEISYSFPAQALRDTDVQECIMEFTRRFDELLSRKGFQVK